MERIPCRISWCDATHQNDKPNRANHRKVLLDSETVRVVARWTERLDGRPSMGPIISVRSPHVPDAFGLDLSPKEAVELCDLLCALWENSGVLGFASTLAAGAAVLAPHDAYSADEPLYVADDASERIEGGEDR
ncbi:hypothetical protein [Actinoallomurus sp. NPDC052274]|uniref:hypothetical protein n=1 Tax=Actinoallomurus sp. NPDC052274 TaxID=3155420 RepID=UPI00342A7FE2